MQKYLKLILLITAFLVGGAFPAFAAKDFNVKSDTESFLFVSGTSGNVGIATTVPVGKLEVKGGATAPAKVLNVTGNFADLGGSRAGLYVEMSASAAGAFGATGAWSMLRTTADAGTYTSAMTGAYAEAKHEGDATVTDLIGLMTLANQTGIGPVTAAYGILPQVWKGSGTVANAYGMYFQGVPTENGDTGLSDGVVQNQYGLGILHLTTATLRNIGILLDDDTQGAAVQGDYGILQEDTAPNSFAGNIGIGTTEVTAQLAMHSTGADLIDVHINDDITGTKGIESQYKTGKVGSNRTGDVQKFRFYNGYGSFQEVAQIAVTAPAVTGGVVGGALDVYVQGQDAPGLVKRMTLDEHKAMFANNIGLGTNAPAARLHIATDNSQPNAMNITGADAYIDGNLEVDGKIYGDGSQLTNLSGSGWTTGAGKVYTTTSTDNVGIGTTVPSSLLEVGVQKFNVTSAGCVGIGSTSPAWTLDVNGTVKAVSGFVTYTTIIASQGLRNSNGIGDGLFRVNSAQGPEIIRTVSDAYPGLIVNQSSATATGDILQLKNNAATVFAVRQNGNVGVGTTVPRGLLEVDTGVYTTPFIVTSSGNLGLGTTLPQASLEVGTATNITPGSSPAAAIKGNLMVDGKIYGDGSQLTNLPAGGAAGSTTQVQYNNAGNLAGASGLVYDANGNVGIGTTVPIYKLGIADMTSADNGVYVEGNSGSSLLAGYYLKFTRASANYLWASAVGGDLRFTVNGNALGGPSMIINSSGCVGIGTTIPAAKLDISGSNAAAVLRFTNTASGAEVWDLRPYIWGVSNAGFSFYNQTTASTPIVIAANTGNVGIGTNAPVARLHIATDNSQPNAMNITGADAYIDGNLEVDGKIYGDGSSLTNLAGVTGWTTGTGVVYATNSGDNIGIGSTAPAAKLDVNGSVKIVGGAGGGTIGTGGLGIGGLESAIYGLDITTNNAYIGAIRGTLYSTSNEFDWLSRRSRGTYASPNAVQSGDWLGSFSFLGSINSAPTFAYGTQLASIVTGAPGTAVPTAMVFKTSSASVALTEAMRIDSSGNVGIGTSAPIALLSVGTTPPTITAGSAPVVAVKGNLLVDGKIYGDGSQLTNLPAGGAAGSTTQVQYNNAGNLAGASGLVYDVNGNVGIGTSLPATKLHIKEASISGRETIIRSTLSDAGNDAFMVGNGTNGDSIFWPMFAGYGSSTTRSGLAFRALVPSSADASDSSDRGLIDFEVVRTDNASDPLNGTLADIQNRKAFRFGTVNSTYMTIVASGNLGIGTTAPLASLDVVGKGRFGATSVVLGNYNLNPQVLVTGTANVQSGMLVAVDDATSRGEYQIARSRGTLAAPTVVQDGDKVGSFSFAGYSGGTNNYINASLVEAYVDGAVSDGVVPMRLSLVTGTNSSTRAERLVIKNNGNVGIGTTVPNALFQVYGNVNLGAGGSGSVRALVSVSGDSLVLRNSSGDYGIAFSGGTSSSIVFNSASAGSVQTLKTSGTIPLAFGTSNVERMRIDSNGNVGVGTIAPVAKLHVGSTPPSGTADLSSDSVLIKGNLEVDGKIYGDGSGLTNITSSQWTTSSPNIYYSAGNVGINSATPAAKLEILGAGTTTATTSLSIRDSAGVSKMIVLDNGNVGIGTMVPGAKLEVLYASGAKFQVTDYAGFPRLMGNSDWIFLGGTQVAGSFFPDNDLTRPFGAINRRFSAFYSQQITDTGSNVGIGTSLPLAKLHVANDNTTPNLMNITGSDLYVKGNIEFDGKIYGDGSQLTGLTSSQWITSSPNIYYSTGNVGINSAVPAAKLEILGAGTTSATRSLLVRDSAGASKMAVLDNGNVGIGSIAPQSALDVVAAAGSTVGESIARFGVADAPNSYLAINNASILDGVFVPVITSVNGDDERMALRFTGKVADALWSGQYYPAMTFQAQNRTNDAALSVVPVLSFLNANTSVLQTWYDGRTKVGGTDVQTQAGGGLSRPGTMLDVIGAGSDHLMNLIDGTTSRFYVKEDGNVGVGTTAPAAALHVGGGGTASGSMPITGADLYVKGNIEFDGAIYGDATYLSNLPSLTEADTLDTVTGRGPSTLNAVGIGTTTVTGGLTTTGNVGIGTSVPGSLFDVAGTAQLRGAAGGTGLVVSSTGNVGIGTTVTSGYKFNVDGDIFARAGNIRGGNSVVAPYGNFTDASSLLLSGGTYGVATVSIGGTASRTIAMLRNTTAGTAGQGLTIDEGGARVNGTDLAGGDLTLKAGISTGTGSSEIHFYTATPGSTGTSDNTPTEKMTISGSGNVGIGTVLPAASLHVGGGGTAPGSMPITGADLYVKGNIEFDGAIYGDATYLSNLPSGSGTVNSGISGYFSYYQSTGTAVDDTSVVYTDGINVGIGSTAPVSKLAIFSENWYPLYLTGSASNRKGGTMLVQCQDPAGYSGTNILDEGGVLSASFQYGNSGAGAFTNEFVFASRKSTTPIKFYQGGVNDNNLKFVIDASNNIGMVNANVGVGTTAPAAALHVGGGGTAPGSMPITGADLYVKGNIELDGKIYGDGSALTNITSSQWTTSSPNIYYSTGNVGINSAVPAAKLEILGAGTTSATSTLSIRDSDGAVKLTVLDNGNVGIASVVPVQKLDVAGNIRTSGSLSFTSGANGLVTLSNSSGNASLALSDSGKTLTFYSGAVSFQQYSGAWYPVVAISSGGNLGVGTSAPVARLHVSTDNTPPNAMAITGSDLYVKGNIEFDGKIYGDGTYLSNVPVTEADTLDTVTGRDSNTVNAVGIGTATVGGGLTTTGNVGVGSAVPAARLEIMGAGTTSATTALSIRDSAGASKFMVVNDGNIGIGTTDVTSVVSIFKTGNAVIKGVSNNRASLHLYSGGGSQIRQYAFNGTWASKTIVAAEDTIGQNSFHGYDGSAFIDAGYFRFKVESAPGTNSMPAYFHIGTTPSGASSSLERMRITSAGNVGIGTTGPIALLNIGTTPPTITDGSSPTVAVKGNLLVDGKIYGDGTYLSNVSATEADTLDTVTARGATTVNAVSIGTTIVGGGLTTTGNVGIGTTVPSDNFVVFGQGASINASFQVNSDTAGDRPSFRFYHRGASGGQSPDNARMGLVSFLGVDSTSATFTGAYFDSHLEGAATSGAQNVNLKFFTMGLGTSAERLRIAPSGNVGINASAPVNKLDVNGSMAVGSYAGTNTAPANSLIVSGSVGVGSTAPVGQVNVKAGSGAGQVTIDGASGGCLMIRDTNGTSWTECYTLNGTLSCSADADGICDGS